MSGRDKWRFAGIGPRERKARKVRPPAGRVISTIWRVVFFEREDLPCGAMDPAPPSSVPPKVLEPIGCHVGVPDGVLNVLVPEVMLQGPRVVAVVGELEPTGMAKHVRVDREWHLGGLPEALDETVETNGTDWPAALGNEHVGVSRVIAAQLAQRPHLVTPD